MSRSSLLRAAWVIARRDFIAVLFSKAFVFFLLGPLFPIVVGALAGGIGAKVAQSADRAAIGLAMPEADAGAILRASRALGGAVPGLVPELRPLGVVDPQAALASRARPVAAVLSGTLAHPLLTGPDEELGRWRGALELLVAQARAGAHSAPVAIATRTLERATPARDLRARIATAQAAQLALFLLTMLLAGMVLSNLVEEKGNKIIEVLAAAMPMDALFLGKLFAMLAVSLVGIAVWSGAGGALIAAGGSALPLPPPPATGWTTFLLLGFLYFAMAYLLLGSLFLSIGALAATVREVQTLSMPVTMLQLLVFFFASYALTQPGGAVEWGAILFPFSSPFAMIAQAARYEELWPHVLALAWQAAWVALIVRMGALLFRRTVMKSGSSGKPRRWGRRRAAPV